MHVSVFGLGYVGTITGACLAREGHEIMAVDISDEKLGLAQQLGATAAINAGAANDVAEASRDLSGGGAHVSVDAIGNAAVCFNSIECLRKRGKHIQVGLMVEDDHNPRVPMGKVLANELEILGSHGMQAHRYKDMLAMIAAGNLEPERLVGKRVCLEEAIAELTSMNDFGTNGVAVITEF